MVILADPHTPTGSWEELCFEIGAHLTPTVYAELFEDRIHSLLDAVGGFGPGHTHVKRPGLPGEAREIPGQVLALWEGYDARDNFPRRQRTNRVQRMSKHSCRQTLNERSKIRV